MLSLHCFKGSSAVAVSRGCSPVAMRGLLIGVASPGSVVAAHMLCCLEACGIFLDQGLKWRLLHWQTDSLPLSQQGSPDYYF